MVILNFHGLGPVPRDIEAGEADCWLDTPHFESILDRVMEDDRILLTFDDGNASDHGIALPALLRRGMKATFFVCSGRVGMPTFLKAGQIRELDGHGMAIGSHGVNHRPWRSLDDRLLQEEVAGSREALEKLLGSQVESAACPFGDYDRRVLRILKNAGYQSVFTSDGGGCDPAWWLKPRTTVRRSFTPAHLDRILSAEPRSARKVIDRLRVIAKANRPRPLARWPGC
ncbi:MAG TPA: polysaccharide deacetylase family protein [Luteolibacter sp.]|nr:polysaccharide deacetylase family protein [Luteolibacter sp.]